ncbi:MAG TPA: glycosyltransferase family 2 protein [Methylotenera sp.]|nr:glycosyltransferase family 2 protein [Methylotenera sp.]
MEKTKKPLITVIVAVFNGDGTLQECISSIARQTYTNKELIIIDGGSKDGTVNLLKTNSNYINYWVSEPDKGIYNAWNKGLLHSTGEWVCFIGADDFFWDSNVLEQMSKQLAKLPIDIRVAYGQTMLLNEDGKKLYPIGEPWYKIKKRFRQVMCIPHSGAMHRRSLLEQFGGFDESFRIAGDYDLLMRELKTFDAAFIPNLITTGMRQGGISSKPANGLLAMREMRRVQKLHGQSLPGLAWIMTTTKVYIRLLLWRWLGEDLTRKVIDKYKNIGLRV